MSDFKAKMHRVGFPLGLRLRPSWGTYSAERSPRPFLYLRGLLLREGWEGKAREKTGEGSTDKEEGSVVVEGGRKEPVKSVKPRPAR